MTEQMAYASRMTIAGHPMEFKTHSIKQVIELSEDDGLREAALAYWNGSPGG